MTTTDLYRDPSKINWGLPIVIDFETYYDKDYSLSKITTEKYIRCDKFEMIGVSIKVGANPTEFYRREEGLARIRELVRDYETSPFISHNSTFDCGILGLRYNIHPLLTVDTVIMAKLSGLDRVAGGKSLSKLSGWMQAKGLVAEQKRGTVHNMLGVHAADMTEQQWQEYGDYCKLDSDLCYALYNYMLPMCQVDELLMSDITTKMWTKPAFDLDVPLLQDYAVRLEAERTEKLSALAVQMGFSDLDELHKHLRSSAKFVALLESLGVECPMKWSEKKKCMIPAVSKTDQEFLALKEHDDELVQLLVETKLGAQSSMEATRTQTLLDIASRGLMPVPLSYAAAHTGRYGGCFVGETAIYVRYKRDTYERLGLHNLSIPYEWHMMSIPLRNLTTKHQVWDGEEWVDHGGLVCAGIKECITWDKLTGTPGHQCFLSSDSAETMSLEEFMQQQKSLVKGEDPFISLAKTLNEADRMNVFYTFSRLSNIMPKINYVDGASVLVFDILDCGPRKRYMANGKLVHNSDKLNLQNLSKRTKEPVLRQSMRAKKGHIVLPTDSSQIELRVNSVVSDQQDLVRIFQDNLDPYVDMAAAIYHKTYDEILHAAKVEKSKEGKAMRQMGKLVCLAAGYGMSAPTFKYRMLLEKNQEAADMADELISAFRTKNHKIAQFWKTCQRALDVMYGGQQMWFGGADDRMFLADGTSTFHGVVIPSILFPNGTRIWYQNLRKEADEEGKTNYVYDQLKGRGMMSKRIWGSALCENIVQKQSFDILKWQALEIAKAGVPIHLNVHDEWVSVVPDRLAAKAAIVHCRAMKTSPPWFPPGVLDCEVDVGRNYGTLATIHPEKYL